MITTNQKLKTEKKRPGQADPQKTRPNTDWKRFAQASSLLTSWGLGLIWDLVSNKQNQEKVARAIRMGKACGKISILIQRLQLPADLLTADAYKKIIWQYLRGQEVEKLNFIRSA